MKFNKEQPYVFISYTKLDKEKVHPFADRLRNANANVWMDDLLGRRAGSWITDVLPIVVNPNRVLTLMFRSANSLINKNVYSEIEKSIRVKGDQSVHIVDLHDHKENISIYTDLYCKAEPTFLKMTEYIAEEANAYLISDEADFKELLDTLKELGVIADEIINNEVVQDDKTKKEEVKTQPVNTTATEIKAEETGVSANDSRITIGEVRTAFSDNLFALDFRAVREAMPRGGKGAMDYAMAAILGGCNQVTNKSPLYQINYYVYDIATQDESKKKENSKLGATWTWSSNCRKVIGIDGSGPIPKEINQIFADLSEETTLGEIEQWFKEGKTEAFQTKKNDLVIVAVQRLTEFMKK